MTHFDRRQFLATTAAGAAAFATSAQAQNAEAALNTAFDDFFNQSLDHSPEQVTSLGLDKGPRAAAKF